MIEIIQILTGLLALFAAIVTALWAYSKFIIERGLLPPVQFDIECKDLDLNENKRVIEIVIHLKNLGSATLVARNIRLDIRYRGSDHGEPELFAHGKRAGRLKFPGSVIENLGITPDDLPPQVHRSKPVAPTGGKQRGFAVMSYDTIVRPAVDQIYTFVSAIPANAEVVLTWSSFEYAQRPSGFQNRVLRISRSIGLIQYSLQHMHEPHTLERAFSFRANEALRETSR